MRDRKAYEAHGRNDPTAPEQLREHPYDFVALPSRPARGEAVGHHCYASDRLTGTLRLVYVTVTPLRVGSGAVRQLVTAEGARQCTQRLEFDPFSGRKLTHPQPLIR